MTNVGVDNFLFERLTKKYNEDIGSYEGDLWLYGTWSGHPDWPVGVRYALGDNK